MASSSFIHFFLLTLSLFSIFCLSAPTTNPNSFTLPIKKDPSTNLFYTTVGIGTPRENFNLAIDLSGENLWYDCNTNYNSSSYTPYPCGSPKCPDVGCISCDRPFKPGCTNNTCPSNTLNPLAKFVFGGGLGDDIIFISQQKLSGILSACLDLDRLPSFTGNESALNGLPKITRGIVGLSRSNLSLPFQLALKNNLQPKFSLCLPSSNKRGFTNLLLQNSKGSNKLAQTTLQTQITLQTTPLIVNPVSTGAVSVEGVASKEYFIDVKSVKIDGSVLNIKPSLLSIDKKGNGGTKISTMVPFTELNSNIYKPFIREFLKKASDRKLKRVASVAPFEVCFDKSNDDVRFTLTGIAVPDIDLELEGGVKWTIYGANSMVEVKKNVVCLAFVDGGTEPKMSFVKASIVIGGHQLEDNLLEFDLGSNKLSFSSSLLQYDASCSS